MPNINLNFNSRFYKNCKRNRKNGAKICNECPFREFIENKEKIGPRTWYNRVWGMTEKKDYKANVEPYIGKKEKAVKVIKNGIVVGWDIINKNKGD